MLKRTHSNIEYLGLTLGSILILYLIFSSLISPTHFVSDIGNGYSSDKQNVYLNTSWGNDNYFGGTERIVGADPNTFKYIGSSYAIDQNRGYYRTQGFEADPTTLKVLGQQFYARDNKNVYYRGRKLSGDVESFKFLSPGYPLGIFTKDKDNVYNNDGSVINNADAATIRVIGSGVGSGFPFLKDNYHVFYGEHLIQNADLASFVVLSYPYAKDINSVYCKDIILDADPNSFTVLPVADTQNRVYAVYGKDNNTAYYCPAMNDVPVVKMEAVDLESFKTGPTYMEAYDKFYKYHNGKKVLK